MYSGYITDIEGVRVGHEVYKDGLTGVSVLIFEEGAVCSVDVRGGAPGTREIALLNPKQTVSKIHSIVLSGGSAYGLNTCNGVMKYLEERNIGFDVGKTVVPIVCGAVIFDLNIGDYKIRPDEKLGYLAAKNSSEKEIRQGNVGAGLGATVGKILGPQYAMKGGVGSASMQIGKIKVGAIVVVNAYGDIYEEKQNKYLAGPNKNNKIISTEECILSNENKAEFPIQNTTIAAIVTNGIFSKTELQKIAEVTHNGFARSIHPVHTMLDGDTVFAASTEKEKANLQQVIVMATETMRRAIINAIYSADGVGSILANKDIK